jgi:hypothetical protein
MSDRLISMVATSGAAALDPDRVTKAMRPYLAASDPRPAVVKDDVEGAGSFVVTAGPLSVAVLPFPFPIPAETLSDALGNELIWKDAGLVFAASGGHVLLAVVNPSTDARQMVDQARLLTIVTAAVLEHARGVGVFWASAQYVIPPDRFVAEARSLTKSQFASALWFSFRFFPGREHETDNKIVCQSTGLEVFLGRELECGPYDLPPDVLAEKVIATARYMATVGPVFGDGHTIGFGEDRKDARLRFRWSPLGGVNRPVFGLELLSEAEETVRP